MFFMIYRSLFLQSFVLYTEILQNHLLTHANFTVIVLKMPIKYLYLTMDFHGTQKTCIHSLLYTHRYWCIKAAVVYFV